MTKRPLITHQQAKGMRKARLDGKSFREIMMIFGVSMTTACRYGDPDGQGLKQAEYNKARWRRNKDSSQ